MKTREKTLVDKLARIQRFLDKRARVLFAVDRSRARAELDELLGAIEQADLAQRTAAAESRRLTAQRMALRKVLLDVHLRPIVAVARARQPENPRLAGVRVPDGWVSDIGLIATATAIVAVLDQCRPMFIAEGFPDDFVDQLVRAVSALDVAGGECSLCRLQGTDATRTIARLVSRGSHLAQMLDVLVRTRICRNVRLKAEWRAVMGAGERLHVCAE